jgi:hypothetical protein
MQCGSDGCGGKCATCPAGYGCNNTQCVLLSTVKVGSFEKPIMLFSTELPGTSFIGTHRIDADLLSGIDLFTPSCFPDGTAKDLVFSFTTPTDLILNHRQFTIDARVIAKEGELVDTVVCIVSCRCICICVCVIDLSSVLILLLLCVLQRLNMFPTFFCLFFKPTILYSTDGITCRQRESIG